MAEPLKELLKEITAERKEDGSIIYNRFNKKTFTKLINSMAAETDLTAEIVNVSKGEIKSKEELELSKTFRSWVRKVVESAGVDPSESEIVLKEEFKIPNMDWLYDFFAEAIWMYIESGNRFDLHQKEDFQGTLFIKEVDESKSITHARNPQTHEELGDYETTSKKHRSLGVKSTCPKYLQARRKLS